jgi:hypothetical protein
MFKQWCNSQGFFVQGGQPTHLFMDGGKLHIPTNKLYIFLSKYIECINNGEKICLVEKLGKNVQFRFFLDIDFKKVPHLFSQSSQIIDVSNKVMTLIGDIYICSEKKGIHLIYNKPVSFHVANGLCNTIRSKLSSDLQQCIDSSVYATGLRMIGSSKYCSGELIDRQYFPVHSDILTWDSFKHSVVRLKEFVNTDSNFSIKNDFDFLNVYIKKLSSEYENSIISGKKLGNYICFSTSSKWCTNKDDFHKNAKIYFVLSPQRQIYQKCHCPCAIHRPFGFCNNYKSKSILLSEAHYKKVLYLLKS